MVLGSSVPHPFHVLCEMGGKPEDLPHGNCDNALGGKTFTFRLSRLIRPSPRAYSTTTRRSNFSSSGVGGSQERT